MYHYYTCLLIWCGRHGVWRCTRLLNTKWAWEYGTHGDFKFFYFFFLLVGFFFFIGHFDILGSIWSSYSNSYFYILNNIIYFFTYFFTHTCFKKLQKTLNNNSQTHSPNRLLIFDTSFKKCEMGCASKVSHMRFTSWFLFLFICLFKLF